MYDGQVSTRAIIEKKNGQIKLGAWSTQLYMPSRGGQQCSGKKGVRKAKLFDPTRVPTA